MHPTDNGQGSRQRLLPITQFQAALTSPFGKICAAALTPPASSLITPNFSYFPCSKVLHLENNILKNPICQYPYPLFLVYFQNLESTPGNSTVASLKY